MNREFKTAKGTVLPILNLRGKEYLEVKYRIVWFREERPEWRIETEIYFHDENKSIVRAKILDDKGNVMAMGTKQETAQGFGDHLEKGETGAIGRALALLGYGTQFCADELDEGDRIVDAPTAPKNQTTAPSRPQNGLSGFLITFGKYQGKRLSEVHIEDLLNYEKWIRDEAVKKGKALTGPAKDLANAIEEYSKQSGVPNGQA